MLFTGQQFVYTVLFTGQQFVYTVFFKGQQFVYTVLFTGQQFVYTVLFTGQQFVYADGYKLALFLSLQYCKFIALTTCKLQHIKYYMVCFSVASQLASA